MSNLSINETSHKIPAASKRQSGYERDNSGGMRAQGNSRPELVSRGSAAPSPNAIGDGCRFVGDADDRAQPLALRVSLFSDACEPTNI
jgi:hypothetical protein